MTEVRNRERWIVNFNSETFLRQRFPYLKCSVVNQVPKYLEWERMYWNTLETTWIITVSEVVFLPLLAAIRKSLLYLENQMMRLDLGSLFNDILRYNIIINGQHHFHALLIITLQYFSSDWPTKQGHWFHCSSDWLTADWLQTGLGSSAFFLIWYQRW